MFTVRCASNWLWHPSVHHSLLLLRALQQPHTLVLESPSNSGLTPLTSDCVKHLSIVPPEDVVQKKYMCAVHEPDHLLLWWSLATRIKAGTTQVEDSEAGGTELICSRIQSDLPQYLDASVVSSHLMRAVDALLLAMSGAADLESVRQMHANVLNLVEVLDSSLKESENTDDGGHNDDDGRQPLSTWPLYATLHFLIEQGGLLTSPYPCIHRVYHRLHSEQREVRLHHRLVQQTVDGCLQRSPPTPGVEASAQFDCPQRGFLVAVQRSLHAYTTSLHEEINEGVVGDQGPLRSRVSGGRLGLQAVPARLPWTMQGTPLKPR